MKKLCAAIALTFAGCASALATQQYTYVGSWEVDQGPYWGSNPIAYSGLTAAALLFGGNAADYVISTLGIDPGAVNHEAWYSIIGVGGGTQFNESYLPTLHYMDIWNGWDVNNSASAYVQDNAGGPQYTNYAFRVADISPVPEPLTVAMLLAGLGVVGATWRKRDSAT